MNISVEEQIERADTVPPLIQKLNVFHNDLKSWVKENNVFFDKDERIIGVNGKCYEHFNFKSVWPYKDKEYLSDGYNFNYYLLKLKEFLESFEEKFKELREDYEKDLKEGFKLRFYDVGGRNRSFEVPRSFADDLSKLFKLLEIKDQEHVKELIERFCNVLKHCEGCSLFGILNFNGWERDKKEENRELPVFTIGVYKVCSTLECELIHTMVWGQSAGFQNCLFSFAPSVHVYGNKILHCYDSEVCTNTCKRKKFVGHCSSHMRALWDIACSKNGYITYVGGVSSPTVATWDDYSFTDFSDWALHCLGSPQGHLIRSHSTNMKDIHHDDEEDDMNLEQAKRRLSIAEEQVQIAKEQLNKVKKRKKE